MLDWWSFYTIADMKHKELIKQAEKSRLFREMRPKPKKVRPPRLLCSFLNSIGQTLVDWGYSLQKRYST